MTDKSNTPKSDEPRVLLVEDYWVNQKVALRMLGRIGITPELAENGQEAVDAIQREAFDIVFMDCKMPVMDGYEATSTIRELEADQETSTPIVAMTAHGEGDEKKCFDVGMDDFIKKPIHVESLLAALSRFCSWAPEA